MKKETENWLKIARHDLKIAEALFKEGLYLGVIEHGHAALEKLIKGIIVGRSNKTPPKIHSLLELVSLALIENLETDMRKLLQELDIKYIAVRYPEDIDYLQKSLSKETAQNILSRVKEVFKCLEKNIQM